MIHEAQPLLMSKIEQRLCPASKKKCLTAKGDALCLTLAGSSVRGPYTIDVDVSPARVLVVVTHKKKRVWQSMPYPYNRSTPFDVLVHRIAFEVGESL